MKASASNRVVGLLLAAGAGRRHGGPKALVDDWLRNSVEALRDGGCDPVIVVLGAGAEAARKLVPPGVNVVIADDWDLGMGSSLRAGLEAAQATSTQAVMIHLVDLPDVGSDVVARMTGVARPGALARASYAGVPGHPVVIGRDHWAGMAASAVGDQGGRHYLDGRDVTQVECADLATGQDVDQRDGSS